MTDGVVKTKSSWGRTPGVLRELGVPLFVLLLCFFPQDDIPSRAGGPSEVNFWKQETVISKSIN